MMAWAKANHLQQLIERWSPLAKLSAGLAGAALVVACSPTHAGPGTRQTTPSVSAPASVAIRVPANGFDQGCWVPDLAALTGRGEAFLVTADDSFVSIVPSASAEVRAAAQALAGRLAQITGRAFDVREVAPSEAKRGFVLGTVPDFPQLAQRLTPGAWQDEEAYLIRSERSRLLLVAATNAGIMDAVWDFLHQLGYRRYFPGAAWQIIPHTPRIEVRTDRFCRPAFHRRHLGYSGGDWKDLSEDFSEWKRENRMGGLAVEASHSYGKIIKAHSEEFAAHPEYLGRKGGKPTTKFCVSEPGLVELVQRYAARQFDARPQRRAISLEPSDGAGWEGCPGDAPLGSPSNRAVTLANAVATSINPGNGSPRFVGMYAYNQHAEPPTVAVHPNVVVFAANGFLAGRNVLDILRGWRAKGQREGGTLLGVREYYSVNTWDRDLPGQARATSPRAIAEALSTYYSVGARFFITEAGDGWGPHGLAYWTAAASLWTADQPADAESYVRDFLSHAFRRAATPMRAFYAYLDRKNLPLFGPELVGELYRLLGQAMALEAAPPVQLRLQHLARYVRYLDLWLDYDLAPLLAARQQHFEELMRFTYSIRKEHMVHSWRLRRDLAKRNHRLKTPAGSWWGDPERDPWRNGEPVTPEAVASWIRAAQARPRLVVGPVLERSSRLVRLRSGAISSRAISGRTRTLKLRGKQRFELVFDAPTTLELGVRAGMVRRRGPVKLTLCAAGSAAEACQVKLAHADKLAQSVSLHVPRPGQYTLLVDDSRQGVQLTWPVGTALSIPATRGEQPALWGRWSLYLYVPSGTRELVLYSSPGRGSLLDPLGKVAHVFGTQRGIIRIPVPSGQDGKVWKFHENRGQRLPLNVPPWFAASPDELLVPAGVP